MEFLQLTYFRHAAKSESFSEVARAFSVPPSSVSLSVKRLESELGVSLFDRTANRLILNDKGRRFLKAVDEIFETLAAAEADLTADEGEPSGEIKILLRTHRRTLTEKIAAFRASYPRVRFSIHHGKEDGHAGGYHVIVSDTPPARGEYECYPLLSEPMAVALPEGHALAGEETLSLSRLAGERFITMTRGTSLREFTERLFHAAGISLEIAIECDDPYYLREYLRMGFGVAVVPTVSWKDQFPSGIRLCALEDAPERPISLYLEKSAPPAARRFADMATEKKAPV